MLLALYRRSQMIIKLQFCCCCRQAVLAHDSELHAGHHQYGPKDMGEDVAAAARSAQLDNPGGMYGGSDHGPPAARTEAEHQQGNDEHVCHVVV